LQEVKEKATTAKRPNNNFFILSVYWFECKSTVILKTPKENAKVYCADNVTFEKIFILESIDLLKKPKKTLTFFMKLFVSLWFFVFLSR